MKTATTKNTLLRWYLDQRSDRGDFDTVNRDGMRLRQELESLTDSVKIGQLMCPVSHEISNCINVMMLQLSVVEAKMPEHTRGELSPIREQVANVVAVLKQLRDCRRRQQRTPRPVDLHRTVWQSITEINREMSERNGNLRLLPTESKRTTPAADSDTQGIPVLLKLARGLPQVNDNGIDLRVLCAFLLNHAMVATAPGGLISIRTVINDNQVLLGIEDSGPNVEPALLPRLFEVSVSTRPGANSLELAACKGLVANLGGRIEAHNLRDRGVAICVQLPLVNDQ
jgi:two-component system, NtrC family, sensor kinase